MRSNNKRFSFGLAALFAVGIGASAVVLAEPLTGLFSSGDTLTADKLNNGLFGNLAAVPCVVNTGDSADGVVRVGPLCVDKYQARASFGACPPSGVGAACAAIVATSTAAGTAAVSMSWSQAQRACNNAGKRLLTPGEWMAGFNAGAFADTATDKFEFVDAFLTRTLAGGEDLNSATKAQAGYIGRTTAATPSGDIHVITNVNYDALVTPTATFTWHFRCGR
jgi:hypothetical protein